MLHFLKKARFLFYLFLITTLVVRCTQPQKIYNQTQPKLSKITADTLLWNVKELYKTPNYRVIDSGKVYSIVYESMKFNDTLREVFAYYSNPSLLKGETETNKTYPGIVLAHGGGGRAFKEWVEMWAAKGYAAIAYDMSARDGLKSFHLPPGPKATNKTKFLDIDAGLKNTWSYFAIGSTLKAHSLLLSRPEVDKNKTAITGISWGGYITCIVAGLDARFKAACSVYGCGFYDEMKKPNQQFSLMTKKNVALWMNNIDPKHYLPNVSCPIYFISGNKDTFFNLFSHKQSYDLVPGSQKNISLVPDMKHSHQFGWAPAEIAAFFDAVLKDKAPLSKIQPPELFKDRITALYKSPATLKTYEFWYSKDTINSNTKREWNVIKGKAANNKIIVKNPGKEMLFGFIRLTDDRGLSVSSNLFYQKK